MVERWLGQRLGNYQLLQLLGRGGFAEVYLGQHVHLSTQAAVKVLYTQMSDEAVQSFQREARIIAGLSHPHILRILDFDVRDGIPFLVMDYAQLGTLRKQYPRGTQLSLPLVASYVVQVAQALQYAHSQKIIHRDVKPENMLLSRNGDIVLSDFGIATMTHHTSSLSHSTFAGTAPYMAPEQIQGKPCTASDQYALGIVAYEWLCGVPPFKGSAVEIAMQHCLTSVPPLRQHVPTILPKVEWTVLRALAKDPQQRFANVKEFATTLEQACQQSVSAHSFSFSHQQVPPTVTGAKESPTSPFFSSSKDQEYEQLRQRVEAKINSFIGGALVVRANDYQVGDEVHVIQRSYWDGNPISSLLGNSPDQLAVLPGTKHQYLKQHTIDGSLITAAVFNDLHPDAYVVWIDSRKSAKTLVCKGEALLVTL